MGFWHAIGTAKPVCIGSFVDHWMGRGRNFVALRKVYCEVRYWEDHLSSVTMKTSSSYRSSVSDCYITQGLAPCREFESSGLLTVASDIENDPLTLLHLCYR